MKAYLSDRAARPYNAADFEDDAVNAWAAMREARRILTDTEPTGPPLNQQYKGRPLSDSAYAGAYETPIWAIRGGEMALVLAESLAAFIAAPIE